MSYDKFILYLHQIFINIRNKTENLQALASKRALCKKKYRKCQATSHSVLGSISIFLLVNRSHIQLGAFLNLSSFSENIYLFFGNLCCYKKEFYSFLRLLWEWLVTEVILK